MIVAGTVTGIVRHNDLSLMPAIAKKTGQLSRDERAPATAGVMSQKSDTHHATVSPVTFWATNPQYGA